MTDFILSKVNEMSGMKNVAAGSYGAETGGASPAETGGNSLVETGGASQHGHGDGQERKVVILVNKCDVAGDFYGDDNKNVNQDNNIVSLIENKYDNRKVIPISAKTGKGLST